jgi:hypothetical protein
MATELGYGIRRSLWTAFTEIEARVETTRKRRERKGGQRDEVRKTTCYYQETGLSLSFSLRATAFLSKFLNGSELGAAVASSL